jgi:hypothetical protein
VNDELKKLINCIFDVHQDGIIDCETCGQQLNHLAELVASGAELGSILPAVEAHLGCCVDCREEFEALLTIVRAENQGLTSTSH